MKTKCLEIIKQLNLNRFKVAEILDVSMTSVSRKKSETQGCYFNTKDLKNLKDYKKKYIKRIT